MARGNQNEVEVDVGMDVHAEAIARAFNQIDQRIRQVQREMANVSKESLKAAQNFKTEIMGTMRDFNKAQGVLDKFEKNIRAQTAGPRTVAAISGAQAARDVRSDASRYGATTVQNGLKLERELATERLLSAEGKVQQEQAEAQLRMLDRKLRVIDAITKAEQRETGELRKQLEAQNALSMRKQRAQAPQFAQSLANQYGAPGAAARLGFERDQALRRLDTAANDRERKIALDALDIAKLRVREAEKLVEAHRRDAEEIRKANEAARKTLDTGLRSDGASDRALRTNMLRGELRAMTEINAVEMRRDVSSARLNQLMAQRAALAGRERQDINQIIAEEIRHNRLIDDRINKLRAEEAQRARNAQRAGAPSEGGGVFGKSGLTGVVARTAAYGGAAAVLYGAVGMARDGAQFAIEWEDALQKLAAVANATQPEMEKLSESIGKVGAQSKYSLMEITEIATTLAQAGVSVGAMEPALRSVTMLAAASGATLAEAADLTTASMGAFQLQATEAGRIADFMASALNRTRLTVQQAALAIQYVGATAYEQNITLEQLMATTAAVSQAGVRSGSTIGTGMRQFLVDLQRPSEKLTEQLARLNLSMSDVDVTTRGLPAVLNTLNEAGFGASQAYGSLETRAAAFYLVAHNNTDLMAQLQIDFAEAGAAMAANERSMDSLTSQFTRFKNIVGEDFAQSMAPLLGSLKEMFRSMADELDKSEEQWAAYYQRRREGAEGFEAWFEQNFVDSLVTLQTGFLNLLSAKPISGVGWGDQFNDYISGANGAASATERLQAKMNEQAEATGQTQDKIQGLSKEISRLLTQEESLNRTHGAVSAETVSLMGRFEGLAGTIRGTITDVRGLVGALQDLRNEEAGQLIEQATAQAVTARAAMRTGEGERSAAIASFQRTAEFRDMTPAQKAWFDQLGSSDPVVRQAATTQLAEIQRRLDDGGKFGQAQLLGNVLTAQGRIAGARGTVRTADQVVADTTWSTTPAGQQITNAIETVRGLIPTLRTAEGTARTRILSQIDAQLGPLERALPARLQNSDTANDRYVQQSLDTFRSLRAEIRDTNRSSEPSASATRAEAAAAAREADERAQEIEFSAPVRGAINPTSGVGVRARPQGRNGQRGSSNHQGVDIARAEGTDVLATADGVVEFAGTRGAYGKLIIIQHGAGTETRYGHLSKIVVARGQRVSRGEKIGEVGASGTATGNHLHYERRTRRGVDRNPLSNRAPGAVSDIEDTAAQIEKDEEQRAERSETALQRMTVGNADRDLKSQMDTLKTATSQTVAEEQRASINAALVTWENALTAQANAELDSRDATDIERAAYMDELQERINQRREEVLEGYFESFMRNIQKGLDTLQDQWDQSDAAQQFTVDMAQARLQGLQSPRLRGQVPDYILSDQQRRIEASQQGFQDYRRTTLVGRAESKERAAQELDFKQLDLSLTAAQMEQAAEAAERLREEAAELRREFALLDAEEQTGSTVPTGFQENARLWMQDFRERAGLDGAMGFQWSDLFSGMTGAMETAQQSLGTFFSDIFSKTKNVGDAFRDMKDAVLRSIGDMIAQLLAKKAFQLITSLATSIIGGPAIARFHGGQIKAFTGRYITGGVPGRDSVNLRAAKGEYMVRKSAVDSVGVDFMERLNERGAHALKGMGTKPIVLPKAEQKMNVYVVQPEQRPQMGPNDVLVTVANDIASGGQMKQLIKHVSQGG